MYGVYEPANFSTLFSMFGITVVEILTDNNLRGKDALFHCMFSVLGFFHWCEEIPWPQQLLQQKAFNWGWLMVSEV